MSFARAKRLDVVLRLRRMTEERATLELAAAAGRLAQARAGREIALRRLAAEEAWLSDLQVRTATGGEFASATTCISSADEMVEAAGRAISAASDTVFDARARLAEATKARSVVERLRDRALEAARLEAERREIAELGELAGVRHAWHVISGESS